GLAHRAHHDEALSTDDVTGARSLADRLQSWARPGPRGTRAPARRPAAARAARSERPNRTAPVARTRRRPSPPEKARSSRTGAGTCLLVGVLVVLVAALSTWLVASSR
ncbi:MAG TPA: hypothetical protein VE953_27110, partial [Terriglobales bacterium]|nr:hypothetical protein [Terriglobales bacterium]